MILNCEQLPHINRAFSGGASWIDYETSAPRGGTEVGTTSPKNPKSKERTISVKPRQPLSTNFIIDSTDPHTYSSGSLYHDPNSAEDHHHQRFDRFSSTTDGMNIRGSSHHYGQHSTSSNVFLSQHQHYDYQDEFPPSVSGGGGMNNVLSSSPVWYQSVPREGLGNSEELSPYDLSPGQGSTNWSSISQNQSTEQPINSIGLYQTIDGISDDSTLELAQRVLQYPISNEGSQQHSGAGNGHENGGGSGNSHPDVYIQDHRQQQQASNIHSLHQSHAWKEVEAQLMSNKCISIPGGGTLQSLHPMQPGQRSLSRTSIYSNNSSTSDRGSPSMVMLSNFDPANPSIPVQVNTSGGATATIPPTVVSIGASNFESSSPETTVRVGVQRSMEAVQCATRNYGNNGPRGRLVNPSLTHNMHELEIVSSVSSESTPLPRELHISSNLSETNVSHVSQDDKPIMNVKRKQSTD